MELSPEIGPGIGPREISSRHQRGMFIAQLLVVVKQAVLWGAFERFEEGDWLMKVKEVMTPNATAIWLTESLADAAQLMWENDCGVLPIIKDGRKVIGMITDRDICMAATMRDRHPSGVSVEEVMTGLVYSVNPEDEIDQALKAMQEHKIRRLPVVNAEGELEGILSMNDVVLSAKATGDGIAYDDVVKTYQAICRRPVPATANATAAG